jgi:hypothetical protein
MSVRTRLGAHRAFIVARPSEEDMKPARSLLSTASVGVAVALGSALASTAAVGAVPTFRIAQVYSNLDGSTQFIRLTETDGLDGQHHFAGLALTSTHNGITKQFVFPSDLPTDQTAHLSILVAASPQGYVNGMLPLCDPHYFWDWNNSPDFGIPARFLATDGGSIDFAGVDRITYASLPTDGANALGHDLSVGPAVVAPSYCIPSSLSALEWTRRFKSSVHDGQGRARCNGRTRLHRRGRRSRRDCILFGVSRRQSKLAAKADVYAYQYASCDFVRRRLHRLSRDGAARLASNGGHE